MLIRCIFQYFQKKRKVLTINTKMEILTNLENGMKNWGISKKYNVSNSSALHSVIVGDEGSIVCSLWGGVTRSLKGGLVIGNLAIGNIECTVFGALFLNCPNILCHEFRLSSYFQKFFAYLIEVCPPKYRHLLPPLSKLQGVEFSPITSVTVFSNGNKSLSRNAN